MVAEHAPFGWLAQLSGTWAMYADSARFLKGRTETAVDIGVDQKTLLTSAVTFQFARAAA